MKFAPCKAHSANPEMAAGLSCMRIRHDDGRAASAAEIWAEIERLRAENERLHDEIERLREAVRALAASLAWNCFGECRAWGTEAILSPAEDLARRVLREKWTKQRSAKTCEAK